MITLYYEGNNYIIKQKRLDIKNLVGGVYGQEMRSAGRRTWPDGTSGVVPAAS